MIKEAAILIDGTVYTGRRHGDVIRANIKKRIGVKGVQGFVTTDGKFVSRSEAAKIAFKSGQIKKPTSLLMSEDLY